jgi:hypothetical protein
MGIEIVQQSREGNAVPDGTIIQRGFKILIEAKVDAAVDIKQLFRHAASFKFEAQKILLLLTKSPIGNLHAEIKEKIHKLHPDVVFVSTTYKQVCEALSGLFRDHESTMLALSEDYNDYCNDVGLFDQSPFLMRIVPCSQSVHINMEYGIYFHPIDRGYTKHSYVGIYAEKAVRALIDVESVFDVDVSGSNFNKVLVQGKETDEFDQRLRRIIDNAREKCGWDIKSGHRFFCGTLHNTYFEKTSSGGIMGARFVNLKSLLGPFKNGQDVADKLRGKKWN